MLDISNVPIPPPRVDGTTWRDHKLGGEWSELYNAYRRMVVAVGGRDELLRVLALCGADPAIAARVADALEFSERKRAARREEFVQELRERGDMTEEEISTKVDEWVEPSPW
jgi:hypothetical protein